MKKITLIILLLFTALSYAQVGINTATPDASAALDINSTNAGLLIPRLTQNQRDAVSNPATGLLIYQTDNSPGFYFYDGTTWLALDTSTGDPASEVDQGYVEGVYCSKPGATAYSNDTGQDVVCNPYLTINGSEQYLITNELICPDNSEGVTTNIEYWISFEVSQPLMAYLFNFGVYTNTSFCGNDNGDYKQIFKSNSSTFSSSSNLGDLIFNSQVTSSIPKMIFSPGFTYTIRLAGLDSNFRTTSVSNYVVNESIFNNVKFYSSSPDSLVLNEATDQWALLYNYGPNWVNGNILTVFSQWELRWENN
jgi:hypothetical protein